MLKGMSNTVTSADSLYDMLSPLAPDPEENKISDNQSLDGFEPFDESESVVAGGGLTIDTEEIAPDIPDDSIVIGEQGEEVLDPPSRLSDRPKWVVSDNDENNITVQGSNEIYVDSKNSNLRLVVGEEDVVTEGESGDIVIEVDEEGTIKNKDA